MYCLTGKTYKVIIPVVLQAFAFFTLLLVNKNIFLFIPPPLKYNNNLSCKLISTVYYVCIQRFLHKHTYKFLERFNNR